MGILKTLAHVAIIASDVLHRKVTGPIVRCSVLCGAAGGMATVAVIDVVERRYSFDRRHYAALWGSTKQVADISALFATSEMKRMHGALHAAVECASPTPLLLWLETHIQKSSEVGVATMSLHLDALGKV